MRNANRIVDVLTGAICAMVLVIGFCATEAYVKSFEDHKQAAAITEVQSALQAMCAEYPGGLACPAGQ